MSQLITVLTVTLFLGPLALAQAPIDGVRKSMAVSETTGESMEALADQAYRKFLQEAASKNVLVSADHPDLFRVRSIAGRLIPLSVDTYPETRNWVWEVNLVGSSQANVVSYLGGKLVIFTGLTDQKLNLSDDEIAMVMAATIANVAVRESSSGARKMHGVIVLQMLANQLGMESIQGGQLLQFQAQREAALKAGISGMDLAARAGYDPRAMVTMLRKFSEVEKTKPYDTFATHPTYQARIRAAESNMEKAVALYEASSKRSSVSP